MITVYVIGCGGIGGYVLDLLPKTIASCSIDLCYTEAQVQQIMADDNLTVLHSIVDTLVLVDGDRFNMHNAIRQEGGHGSKLVTHMRKIQDSALKRTFLRGMKLVGFPGFIAPGNIAGIIKKNVEQGEDSVDWRMPLWIPGDCAVVFLCVDNHKTRYEVSRYMETFDNCLVINGGNEKFRGHVTIYERRDGRPLDPEIYKLYPEIADNRDKRPDELHCTDLAANKHDQVAVVNSMLAGIMCAMFSSWLRTGRFNNGADSPRKNEVVVDIKEMKMTPLHHDR